MRVTDTLKTYAKLLPDEPESMVKVIDLAQRSRLSEGAEDFEELAGTLDKDFGFSRGKISDFYSKICQGLKDGRNEFETDLIKVTNVKPGSFMNMGICDNSLYASGIIETKVDMSKEGTRVDKEIKKAEKKIDTITNQREQGRISPEKYTIQFHDLSKHLDVLREIRRKL